MSSNVTCLVHVYGYKMEVSGEIPLKFDWRVARPPAKVFWRGATTAYGWDPDTCSPDNQRRALVERWGLSIDACVDVDVGARGRGEHEISVRS